MGYVCLLTMRNAYNIRYNNNNMCTVLGLDKGNNNNKIELN